MFKKEINKKPNSEVMERNLIAKNTTIVGEVLSEGDFRIDGILEGDLKTNGRVIIGVSGNVKGVISATNADIEGAFSGDLKVEKTLTLKETANITGDVVVGRLSVEPGATFNASCSMKVPSKEIKLSDGNKKESKKTIA
jgi:cytoskeletal protein CcmA (bactofilin family)